MRIRIAIVLMLLMLVGRGYSQLLGSPEKSALKHIEHKRWEKVQPLLRKALGKDSMNFVAHYISSIYFSQPGNPAYQIDSAYRQIIQALSAFNALPTKARERFDNVSVDSVMIVQLRNKIDSITFSIVREKNTESGYIKFLEEHPFSSDRKLATELRDEVAYLNALEANTYEAFLTFIEKYPNASKVPDAQRNYARLLFETKTSDKRLSSYEKFLKDHPDTPFRTDIEKNIFELFTLSGEVERILSFLQAYPESPYVKKAQDILYHILQDFEEEPVAFPLTDSLKNIHQLQQSYLVPTYRAGQFSFMDKAGKELMLGELTSIPDEYKCGNITEDVLVLSDRLLARNGKVIYRGSILALDDLGTGYLKIQDSICTKVIHKSGFFVDAFAEDAKVLGQKFIGVKNTEGWVIHSLAGRKLFSERWADCTMFGNVIGLKKKDKWSLFPLDQFVEWVQGSVTVKPLIVDEVKVITSDRMLVKASGRQAVFNNSLSPIIPFSTDQITTSPSGFLARADDGFFVYNLAGEKSQRFENVRIYQSRLAIKKDGKWSVSNGQESMLAFDSLKIDGPFLLGLRNDSLMVSCQGKVIEKLRQPVATTLIQGRDSSAYLTLEKDGKRSLYDAQGQRLFTGAYDQISDAGSGIFIVSKKEKKGLVTSAGKTLLPIEFDAVGAVNNGVISVLKNMRFGLYHILTKKLIKPAYDKNLVPYNATLIAAYKDGLYGFIDWNNKPVGKTEFSEIVYWNDSTAFVRKGTSGMFYSLNTQEFSLPDITSLRFIQDTPGEKVAIVQQQGLYGVLSNKRGAIIPIAFTDLVNIGTADEPLYFTEKHVEEAWLFVVIYYDKSGRFLRREVYEEPDDYEKIYCPDN